jgi:hypothetical protein
VDPERLRTSVEWPTIVDGQRPLSCGITAFRPMLTCGYDYLRSWRAMTMRWIWLVPS